MICRLGRYRQPEQGTTGSSRRSNHGEIAHLASSLRLIVRFHANVGAASHASHKTRAYVADLEIHLC